MWVSDSTLTTVLCILNSYVNILHHVSSHSLTGHSLGQHAVVLWGVPCGRYQAEQSLISFILILEIHDRLFDGLLMRRGSILRIGGQHDSC